MAIPFTQPPAVKFDEPNSTTAWQRWFLHLWNYLTKRAGGGTCNAAGTVFRGPYGWTVTKGAAGVYTINHNIGNTDYGCVVTAQGVIVAAQVTQTANTVVVIFAADQAFSFVLVQC